MDPWLLPSRPSLWSVTVPTRMTFPEVEQNMVRGLSRADFFFLSTGVLVRVTMAIIVT